jgi:drug/metabolite transporter (DMT)-like permease
MRLKADITLFIVAIIWGLAFVAQRQAGLQGSVFIFNGLRFLIAVLVLVPFARFRLNLDRAQMRVASLAGAVLFAASVFQQWGMKMTTAGNAGFLTSLYVVIVPFLLLLFWREKPRWLSIVSVVLAAIGAYFLSTRGGLSLNKGDVLEILSAVFWAIHLLILGKFARDIPVIPFSLGQFFVAGSLNLLAGLFFERPQVGDIQAILGGVLYTGIVSVGLGYTLQVAAQKHTPPTDAAIILSMEAIFAALAGRLWLGEQLLPIQILGCGLIFSGVILTQIRSGKIRT